MVPRKRFQVFRVRRQQRPHVREQADRAARFYHKTHLKEWIVQGEDVTVRFRAARTGFMY